MTTYVNYDDVLDQLAGLGLLVESVDVGRRRRVRVEGERGKPGWYHLHEFRLDSGDYALVGSFGVWRGLDNNAQKIKLKGHKLTDEQRAALKARIAADRKQSIAQREREAQRASARAAKMWAHPALVQADPATCDYLKRKGIQAHGVKVTPDGTLVVPMLDTAGQVHGLQFIGPKVRKKLVDTDKQFWPFGMDPVGKFGTVGKPTDVILIGEGYASVATPHEDTGLYAVYAFTAGNLLAVAQAIRKRYRTARILVLADDDFATRGNPGVSSAAAAATAVNGAWVAPRFDGDPFRADIEAARAELDAITDIKAYKKRVEEIRAGRPKLTDFNDLQHYAAKQGTLHAVRVQIEAKLAELGWNRATPPVREEPNSGAGGRARRNLTPIVSVQEMFDRYAVVYGHSKSLFDFQERILLPAEDVKLACSGRDVWKYWQESPDKKIVRIDQVGFDPSEADPRIVCNLWGGWPTQPKRGSCDRLLELLRYLCENEERNDPGIYDWIIKWLAYPLQNPGAKMKTAIVVHGPQRVGKNFFFESVAEIYGPYGEVIDQDALEDKYNDCFSKKLFLIADEVIARQELYHVKNKLKSMITGRRIRINPKNVKSYWEDNHCNIVFLSNETMPLVLERDDGRHVVLWTPPKLSIDFYHEVEDEVDDGGVAALHHYLKHEVDLKGFTPHTPPPMTTAKRELMDLSMDSTERFWIDWKAGRIDPVPCLPTKSTALYQFYREWSGRIGYTKGIAPEPRFLAEIGKRGGAEKRVAWYLNGSGRRQATFVFPKANEAPPPDKTEATWLSECASEFANKLQQWRDEGKPDG